jgi:hypothetical protein
MEPSAFAADPVGLLAVRSRIQTVVAVGMLILFVFRFHHGSLLSWLQPLWSAISPNSQRGAESMNGKRFASDIELRIPRG